MGGEAAENRREPTPRERDELERLAGEARLPWMALRPDDVTILVANDAACRLLETDRASIADRSSWDFRVEPMRVVDRSTFVTGLLTGFQADLDLRAASGSTMRARLWFTRRVLADGLVIAATTLFRLPADPSSRTDDAGSDSRDPGPHVAVVLLDHSWRIAECSLDVEDLLGVEPWNVVGSSLLGFVHPHALPDAVDCLTTTSAKKRSSLATIAFQRRDGRHVEVSMVCTALCVHDPARLAITLGAPRSGLLPSDGEQGGPDQADDTRVRARLQRVDRELAALAISRAAPDARPHVREPVGIGLTAGEREVVERLVAGERVVQIARALYLSERTVRNRLTAVFAKYGVGSQVELLDELRR